MSLLTIRVTPNASRSEITSQELGIWKIRLAAPPIDGKANETLLRFLADLFNLAPSELTLKKGHASKTKTIEIPLASNEMNAILKENSRK